MSRDDAPGWWLADAEERQRTDRSLPPIPTLAERQGLAPGRFAKLAFRCEPRMVDGRETTGERLWVAIREIVDAGAGGGDRSGPNASPSERAYLGTLQGDPAVVPGLRSGDEIRFTAAQVVDIDRGEGALDFDRNAPAAVDPAVLQFGRPPTRLVRWHPDGFEAPIWFAGIDGTEQPQATLVTLGVLVDRWPELTHPFAAGDGDWVRHEQRPEYVRDRADHVRAMAADEVVDAALRCLQQPRDPQAAEAEAAFDDAVERLVQRYWPGGGEGRFDGIAHAGISRDRGRVRLSGTARVREGADRPIEVDVSPDAGGAVTLHAPPKRRGLLRRTEPDPPLVIPIPGRFTPSALIEH
ncbi:MAG: hypothetical protein Q7T55_24595 [Solirubrobacteraceae bacterium]|nr:hypothetical protein [Solirubrobacteraceae bacterium]